MMEIAPSETILDCRSTVMIRILKQATIFVQQGLRCYFISIGSLHLGKWRQN